MSVGRIDNRGAEEDGTWHIGRCAGGDVGKSAVRRVKGDGARAVGVGPDPDGIGLSCAGAVGATRTRGERQYRRRCGHGRDRYVNGGGHWGLDDAIVVFVGHRHPVADDSVARASLECRFRAKRRHRYPEHCQGNDGEDTPECRGFVSCQLLHTLFSLFVCNLI